MKDSQAAGTPCVDVAAAMPSSRAGYLPILGDLQDYATIPFECETMSDVTNPQALMFSDDGSIPNNPRLPFLLYRNAIDLSGTPDPEDVIETTFARHGWGDMWRNGIFPYVHYHSMIHEALGVARGRARVRFGGAQGQEIELVAGDVVVLPAGTGHQGLWAAPELVVIGAYPNTGKYDLCRGSKAEHAKAIETVPDVPVPDADPVYGKDGPLRSLWRR